MLIALGRYLEQLAKRQTTTALTRLLALQAPSATLLLPVIDTAAPASACSGGKDACCSTSSRCSEKSTSSASACSTSSSCSATPAACSTGKGSSCSSKKAAASSSCCDSSGSCSKPAPSKQAAAVEQQFTELTVDVRLLSRGDIIRVAPGAQIPTDGVVESGQSEVDESMLTGESRPVLKTMGAQVFAGTLNQHGALRVRVTRMIGENTLAALGKLIQDAQASKPQLQQVADVWANRFVPTIIALALVIFALWTALAAAGPLTTSLPAAAFGLQFGLAVLVVSCPCAIALSGPTAIMVLRPRFIFACN